AMGEGYGKEIAAKRHLVASSTKGDRMKLGLLLFCAGWLAWCGRSIPTWSLHCHLPEQLTTTKGRYWPWQETPPLSDATGVYYDTQTEPIRQETNDQESPVILNSKLAIRCIPWSSCSSQGLSYCRRLTSDASSLFLHSPVCHKASVWIIDTPSELDTWPGYHWNIH
ncbi:unnamed protein product, partial [Fusarium graminearum]